MRWPPQRILAGVDFSPASLAAARAAAALARRCGATLELAHVMPAAPPPLVGFEPLDVLLTRRTDPAAARAGALERLEALERELAAERCHIHLPEGVPALELLALREKLGVDLVALGAAGHGIRHYLLGSVADRVMRRAGAPLLLVRRAPPSGEFKKLVIAQEHPGMATPWLELGLWLARDERAEVVLVHVLPPRGYLSDAHHVDTDPERAPKSLEELVARVEPTVPTRIEVQRGDAADVIPAAARAHGAELVVLGAERNRSGWPGRVANRVASEDLPAALFVWPGRESEEDFEEEA